MSEVKKPEELAGEYSEQQIKQYGYAGHRQRVEAYLAGHQEASKHVPIWKKIKEGEGFLEVIVKGDTNHPTCFSCVSGEALLSLGYTHYILGTDLINLSTEQ